VNLEPHEIETSEELHDKLHDKYPQLSEKAFEVLEVLKTHPRFNAEEIGAEVSLSQRQVRTYLNTLKQVGLITREGSNKTGYWKVNIE
jgi:DNA-binding IclR family transcriptional regulator